MEEDREEREGSEDLPGFGSSINKIEIEDILTLTCLSPPAIYNSSHVLAATITLTPHKNLPNIPVEVDIRGLSRLYVMNTFRPSISQLQITQSLIFEEEERGQAKPMVMKESVCHQKGTNLEKETSENSGQYFLEGSQVLFQIDDHSQQRLQTLEEQHEYLYPLGFTLPPNLPVSLEQRLLSSTHVTIQYSLEIRVSVPIANQTVTGLLQVPFEIREVPKTYPFEELVVTQKIRCYHEEGAIKDSMTTSKAMCMLRWICPQSAIKWIYPQQRIYTSRFSSYDLFHVELLVVVSQDSNMFFMVRAYKEPEEDSLTVNRQKRTKTKDFKQKTVEETAPEVSLASIKESDAQPPELLVHKVEVTMFGEFGGLDKESILTKVIPLTRANYDMLEGQSLVDLKDYLSCPKSFRNELFSLQYCFTLRAYLGEEESGSICDCFVVDTVSRELSL